MSILRSRVPPPRSLARLRETSTGRRGRQRIYAACAAAAREEPAAHDRAPAPGASRRCSGPSPCTPTTRPPPRPILGDRFAADLLARVDDQPTLDGTSLGGNTPLICTRATLIDDAARAFLARHDEAVVLHLGCGLDSRVLRLDPGPGVRWFNVDQEPVIELRRQFYDERENVEMIAASVTDPTWWSRVPDDVPRLVLAEGLLMYLDPDGVRTAVTSARARGHPRRRHGRPVGHLDRGLRVGDARRGYRPPLLDHGPRGRGSSGTRRDEVSLVDATATPPAGSSRRPSDCSHWSPTAATPWC